MESSLITMLAFYAPVSGRVFDGGRPVWDDCIALSSAKEISCRSHVEVGQDAL